MTSRWILGAVLLAGAFPATAVAHELDHPVSDGIYRIPYADGIDVLVGGDHHDHDPENRIDMQAGDGEPIVAAASGIVRAVADQNGGPDDDPDVHSCQDNDLVVGECTDYNNYVWIEHPNGEWTKYTHFQFNSVTANGWDAGDAIDAGDLLGVEGDVGRAGGPHLHFEVGRPDDPDDLTPFTLLGGFMVPDFGTNLVPVICDIGFPHGSFVTGESYEAQPCDHAPPTADAGGPYVVNEGTALQLDGTGSDDPEDNTLTFAWSPAAALTGAGTATPGFDAADDASDLPFTLTVYDQIEALSDSDSTTVTVNNVAPSVDGLGAQIDEAGEATVAATFTDPGTLDTHTATIDWGDGTSEPVTVAGGALSASHVYGDDGAYEVTVTVTDDDGGVGSDAATVAVGNLTPVLSLSDADTVAFPGGDFLVTGSGGTVPLTADGTDAGSDDLTFTWSGGDAATFFNNGVSAEPATPSPFGTFPFAASDSSSASFGGPGVESAGVTLSDDDGGSAADALGVIVTGLADQTQGLGWWRHQYSTSGDRQIDAATADAYLEIVDAVSGVFSEVRAVATRADVHAILSPSPADFRRRAQAQLMLAWLDFASGAVPYDATVPATGGDVGFLPLLFAAESTIADPSATPAELLNAEQDLAKVRQAE